MDGFNLVEEKLSQLASPGIKPGLARLARLLSLVGNPERSFCAIHVVGTNGKGSVCAMLGSVLHDAGYKVAIYTSPHLACFGERLVMNGKMQCAENWLCAIKKLETAIKGDEMLSRVAPTYFELATAAAFLLIAKNNIDVAIVEAGLGGRLDATNVLTDVALSVVVQIGMDHTEYLGNTLSEIAAEKFAVVRKNTPALFAGGDSALESQFLDRCAKAKAKGTFLSDFGVVSAVKTDFNGTQFDFGGKVYRTALCGGYQADNSALVISACKILQESFRITEENIKNGLACVKWGGRMELVRENPPLMFDGAHNSHAMKRLAENIRRLFPSQRVNVVMAMMHDKDIEKSLGLLAGLPLDFYCTQVPNMARSMSAAALCEKVKSAGFESARPFEYPPKAIKVASQNGNPTIVCGSLYLIGWIKRNIESDF